MVQYTIHFSLSHILASSRRICCVLHNHYIWLSMFCLSIYLNANIPQNFHNINFSNWHNFMFITIFQSLLHHISCPRLSGCLDILYHVFFCDLSELTCCNNWNCVDCSPRDQYNLHLFDILVIDIFKSVGV